MNIIINKNCLFLAKDKMSAHWHGFITWWAEGKTTDKYKQIHIDKKRYTISEYPNGTLEIIDKENSFQMYSGIWFYIDNIKINLI